MSNVFYFDELNAFGDGVHTPKENEDIIIPDDTIIKITKYIISPNSYNSITIPENSKLVFDTENTTLYVKNTPDISGEIITLPNCSVTTQDISGNISPYQYWHNISSWSFFSIPQPNQDIIIPQGNEIVITHRSNIANDTQFGRLHIPANSKLIIDVKNLNIKVTELIIHGSIVYSSGSSVNVFPTSQSGNHVRVHKSWGNADIWTNNNIPSTGENVDVPTNTILTIDNANDFQDKVMFFNVLTIPVSSILVLDLPDYTFSFKQMKVLGALKIKRGNATYTRTESVWHNPYAWSNNTIPTQGSNVILPNNSKIIITNQSNPALYFNILKIPSTSQLIVDIPNFELRVQSTNIAGSIKLNHGSKLIVIDTLYDYVVKCILSISFTGTLLDTLKLQTPTIQSNIIKQMLSTFYTVPLKNITVNSYEVSSLNINFNIKTNDKKKALNIVYLTTTKYNTGLLEDSLVSACNQYISGNTFTIADISNTSVTSFANIDITLTGKPKPQVSIWTMYPSNKFYKTYYFDDPNAWDNNTVPTENQDILVPQNTIIQITQYSIISKRYNKLIIPINSQIYFADDNIKLYVKSMNIRGLVRTSKNSKILMSNDLSSNIVFYNWNDVNAWNGSSPPKHGEDITIPNNTNIVVTHVSSISVLGYKNLIIPQSSSLIFDIRYFQFYIQQANVSGTLQMGEGNIMALNTYYALNRTYLPIYLDSTGKYQDTSSNAVSSMNADYNFTLAAVSTKAIDIAMFIKYRTILNNALFVYEPKLLTTINNALLSDLQNLFLSHIEGRFISSNSTTSNTLSEMFIQYINDVLIRTPNNSSLITNKTSIINQINNSNLHTQLTGILTTGLDSFNYTLNNIYLKSMYNQIINEKPQRLANRKDYDIHHFPIYGGDDISIFIKMKANITSGSLTEYNTLKSIYNTPQNSNYIEFNDTNYTVSIKEKIWRIFINLA